MSEATFSNLLEIITHNDFRKEDVPKSVNAFKVTKEVMLSSIISMM